MKELIQERRKFMRFHAKEGTLVFLGKRIGQIMNISLKGLSFRYVTTEAKDEEKADHSRNACMSRMNKMDIVYGRNDFYLHSIPVCVVTDRENGLTKIWDRIVMTRRCSVSFGDLTTDQLFLLKRFLLLNTAGAV